MKVSPESLAMFEKLETKVSFIIKDLQFVTVGVLEQLDVSLYVMECLMKDYMKVNQKLPKSTLNILYLTVDKLNISSAFISYFRDCRAFKDWKITMRTATVTRDW